MNLYALPKYPRPYRREVAGPDESRLWFSPRAQRVVRDLVFLVAIIALFATLLEAKATLTQPPPAPAQPRPPLEFKLVAQRYADVKVGDKLSRVHALLGPPTEPFARPYRLRILEWRAEETPDNYKDFPKPRFAEQWTDPSDPNRWGLIIFGDSKVYTKFKLGFE